MKANPLAGADLFGETMFYTVAYPTLADADAEFIRAFRDLHDLPYRDVVAPHFTMIFGSDVVPESDYVAHLEAVAAEFGPIPFVSRYAMLGNDADEDVGYVFLVPDEGYSAISLLHDRLYRGPFTNLLRLDIDYVPHITIGTVQDRVVAKGLCDDLNATGIEIAGWVDSITLGRLSSEGFEDVASWRLEGTGPSA